MSARAWVVLIAIAPLVGCSSTETTPSPPASGTYTIEFPSPAAAVATESISVLVFDASDAQELCNALVVTKKSHGDLPPDVAETVATTPCALASGGGGSLAALPFGTYSFLAVAQRGGADFLVGCSTQTISANQTAVSIPVTFASTQTSIPTTACKALSEACAGSCR